MRGIGLGLFAPVRAAINPSSTTPLTSPYTQHTHGIRVGPEVMAINLRMPLTPAVFINTAGHGASNVHVRGRASDSSDFPHPPL